MPALVILYRLFRYRWAMGTRELLNAQAVG
jgi:hypothetical protein